MPGVDFRAVQASVSMRRVLELLGFQPSERSGDQWRGPCPLHGASGPTSRSFSVNVATGRFQCFRCKKIGNQLELWAAAKNMTVHQGAIDLCQQASVPVPWIKNA